MLTPLVALLFVAAEPATPALQVSAEPDNERLICRTRPMLGSRIARQRVCKTAQEWRVYDEDLRQARRDNGDQSRGPTGRNEGLFPCSPSQPCNARPF
jgi:hypothetical protein